MVFARMTLSPLSSVCISCGMVSDADVSSPLSVDGVCAQPQSEAALIAGKMPSVEMENAPNRLGRRGQGRAIIVLSLLRSKV